MDRTNRKAIIVMVAALMMPMLLLSQSKESGYVKEYNGNARKTPVSGVEIWVKGASSTVSSNDGYFCLNFTTLKPGQQVKYNEIYKPGYVLFNKDELKVWRISNNQSPFTIVMCQESMFRNLQRKYYNLLDNYYQKDYERQRDSITTLLNTVEMNNTQIKVLKAQLGKIEKVYDKKVENIDTYVDILSRIDMSELSKEEARAMEFIENGETEKALAIYDSLMLEEKINTQINALKEGAKMIEEGDKISSVAMTNLSELISALKRQLVSYDAAGAKYGYKKEETMYYLVSLYHELNQVTKGEYLEEEGEWLCRIAETKIDADAIEKFYTRASALPSYCGLMSITLFNECRSIYDTTSIVTAKNNLLKAIAYNEAKQIDIKEEAKNKMDSFYDFRYEYKGNTLSYKILDNKKKRVAVSVTNTMLSNCVSGTVCIPSKISVNGVQYDVVRISKNAFANCFRMDTLIVPKSVKIIEDGAFMNDFNMTLVCNIKQKVQPNYTLLDNHIQENAAITFVASRDVSAIITNCIKQYVIQHSGFTHLPDICILYDAAAAGVDLLVKKGSSQDMLANDVYIGAAAKWVAGGLIKDEFKKHSFITTDYEAKGLAKYGYTELAARVAVYQALMHLKLAESTDEETKRSVSKMVLLIGNKAKTLPEKEAKCYAYIIDAEKDVFDYFHEEGLTLEEGVTIIENMLNMIRPTEEEKATLGSQPDNI